MTISPCPFCGSADAPYVFQTAVREYFAVECDHDSSGCGASINGLGREEAIARWNRRGAPRGPSWPRLAKPPFSEDGESGPMVEAVARGLLSEVVIVS